MNKAFLFIFLQVAFLNGIAQNTLVSVNLNYNNKQALLTKSNCHLVISGDTIRIDSGKHVIPAVLLKKEDIDIIFVYQKYRLNFSRIYNGLKNCMLQFHIQTGSFEINSRHFKYKYFLSWIPMLQGIKSNQGDIRPANLLKTKYYYSN